MKAGMIFMASGFGSRFGSNKLLEMVNGRCLYQYGLETLCKAADLLRRNQGWQVSVTVVSQYPEILAYARQQGLWTVMNPYADRGISASVVLGTQRQPEDTDLYVYSVADQPGLSPETVAGFLTAFCNSRQGIGCLAGRGRRGNPAVFASRYRRELEELTGDRGGSVLMKKYPDQVWTYQAPERELADVDRPQDLDMLKGELKDGSTDREKE